MVIIPHGNAYWTAQHTLYITTPMTPIVYVVRIARTKQCETLTLANVYHHAQMPHSSIQIQINVSSNAQLTTPQAYSMGILLLLYQSV